MPEHNNFPFSGMLVGTVPLKNGEWRLCSMTHVRRAYWILAWNRWYTAEGYKLADSPEMWVVGGNGK